ncbi:Ig-like domain-containing protein [Pseudorhodoferax sp.]|uniref:Ig-like domain-containing protein n=1 Tax=Pseudorhodoferax sp. TaxID=1993553 RepID=UPI002DD6B663|nr:Ig-like domain-containing protein [Pseudorhodoferax sp.]
MLAAAAFLGASGASAQSVGMYLSPPGEQASTVPGAVTENFDRGAGPLAPSGSWAVGNYTATGGQLMEADDYGGAGGAGQYLSPNSPVATISVTFPVPRRYVGFWWSAGDATNVIALYDANDQLLATYTADSLEAAVAGAGNLTAIDGTPYAKSAYYGNPNPPPGRVLTEAFGYVNLLVEGSTARIARIDISGERFELDNLAAADNATPSGGWVKYDSQPITQWPGVIGAADDSASTPMNQAVSGNVSTNDMPLAASNFTLDQVPSHGSAVVNLDGTYTYTPSNGFVGTDSFVYQRCKPAPDALECTTAKVTVTVSPPGASTHAIPTVSEWGLILLSALLGLGAFQGLRRRGI